MESYYDYGPFVTLERHLTIAGYIGEENRAIGFQLAALTGLPVTDLDRTIEHHAGKSVWELIWTEGIDSYRRLEKDHLERSIKARPLGILTLGDGALIDPISLSRVLKETHLVVLDLDLANCYWRLKSNHPWVTQDFWHPLQSGPLESLDQLKPFFQEREPGFAKASYRLSLRGKKRSDVVQELIRLLDQLKA